MHADQQVFDLATAIHTRIGVERQDAARNRPSTPGSFGS
jgi:hypothetical protein